MPMNTPNQQITLPIGADILDGPLAFADQTADLETRLVQRYTSDADRTARNPAPTLGELSIVTTNAHYDRWTGSKWLPATPLQAILTAPQIVNNSTAFVNVTQAVITLPAITATWALEGWLYHASSTTADIKFTFLAPGGGASIAWGLTGLATTAATSTGDMTNDATGTGGTSIAFGGIGTADFINTVVLGTLSTVGAAATIQLQFAQNTLDATNTTLFTGSWIRATAVA
jgi:hypothetical protein